MSRDFLIHFKNNLDRDFAFDNLKEIKLNGESFFGIMQKK